MLFSASAAADAWLANNSLTIRKANNRNQRKSASRTLRCIHRPEVKIGAARPSGRAVTSAAGGAWGPGYTRDPCGTFFVLLLWEHERKSVRACVRNIDAYSYKFFSCYKITVWIIFLWHGRSSLCWLAFVYTCGAGGYENVFDAFSKVRINLCKSNCTLALNCFDVRL